MICLTVLAGTAGVCQSSSGRTVASSEVDEQLRRSGGDGEPLVRQRYAERKGRSEGLVAASVEGKENVLRKEITKLLSTPRKDY